MAIAPGTTLADYVLPVRARRSQQLVRDGILVIGFSIVVALSAQAAIPLPFTPVPITLQTLAVLLTGAALGSKRGGLAMLLYLAEGAAGLPVFAHAGGFIYLVGMYAGYLWACPIAAFVVGLLCERGLDRSYLTSLLAMLPGTILFYALGATWLGIFLHLTVAQSFVEGILPFIPGDLLKVVIAAALVPAAWQIIRMVRPDLKNTKGTI
jgi:biotin transport system substrate-specific component